MGKILCILILLNKRELLKKILATRPCCLFCSCVPFSFINQCNVRISNILHPPNIVDLAQKPTLFRIRI